MMKADGIVAFYSQSDDQLKARGAIYDEWDEWYEGALIFEKGVVRAVRKNDGAHPVWITGANVPSVPFNIIEDGKVRSKGIVLYANDLGAIQEKDAPKECPRCGNLYVGFPALSRRYNIDICPECGLDEAARDMTKKNPLAPDEWFRNPIEIVLAWERIIPPSKEEEE